MDYKKSLNCVLQFYLRWNFKVNINKTKVTILNKSEKILKGLVFLMMVN